MKSITARLKEAQDLYQKAGVNGANGWELMIDAQARIADLEAALTWYAQHVPDCRKTGLEGDVARGKLDRDGGSKARAALEGGG
mgnify:CR=1 FL=1